MAKGQMLRPTKGFPTEVTPENIGQAPGAPAASSLPAQAQPSEPVRADLPPLPSKDAPPAEIVRSADARIEAANAELRQAEARAAVAWVSQVGPAVRLVRDTKAFREVNDPSGKPYRSLVKWAADRGISKSHLFRLVNEIPVSEALSEVYNGKLTTRQVDILAPVLRQHGAETVAKVWMAAQELGGPTPANLEAAKKQLSLVISSEESEESQEVDLAKLLEPRRAAQGDWEPEQLHQAILRNPEAGRAFVDNLDRARKVAIEALKAAEAKP